MNKKIWIYVIASVVVSMLLVLVIVLLTSNISKFSSEIKFFERAIEEHPAQEESYRAAINNWKQFILCDIISIVAITLTAAVALLLLGNQIYRAATTQEYRDEKKQRKQERTEAKKQAEKQRLQSKLDKLDS